jgi:hypothetical protein
VCRMQLLRRNSAHEYARSIDEVGEDPAIVGIAIAVETANATD